MKILVTGGAGFIGSHFTKMALAGELGLPISDITVLDKLTKWKISYHYEFSTISNLCKATSQIQILLTNARKILI